MAPMEPEPTPAPRRVLLVANPISGSGRNRREAPRLAEALAKLGVESEIAFTDRRGHAVDLARGCDPRFDGFVAVGGDGTIREVVEGAACERPVGIYPTGTANVMARELGVPFTAAGAAAVVAGGRIERVDYAVANGKIVLFVLGAGFDAEVLAELEARRKGGISYVSYLSPVVHAFLRFRPAALSVSSDGGSASPCDFLLVSNTRTYAGPWVRFRGKTSMGDGAFELYRFSLRSKLALLGAGIRGLCGALPGGACVRETARRVRIDAQPPAKIEIDGDFCGTTPVELEVRPRALPMFVPADFVL
jgi:diacylglycerol kinase family enzyme